ncbi:MAG: potassium-transporting ATPase subunit C, partial [Fibrobacterota bacterium]|nr:potassium-transporting ATPase subunit C [Chitinispirillaceae bacterium]
WKATGSILYSDSKAIGSALIAQPSPDSTYFSPRPSAGHYQTLPSSASNLAVTNSILYDSIQVRLSRNPEYINCQEMLFASASGLDPHISYVSALQQAKRIERLREMSAPALVQMIDACTEAPWLGVIGERHVNVLLLNCLLAGDTIDRGCKK